LVAETKSANGILNDEFHFSFKQSIPLCFRNSIQVNQRLKCDVYVSILHNQKHLRVDERSASSFFVISPNGSENLITSVTISISTSSTYLFRYLLLNNSQSIINILCNRMKLNSSKYRYSISVLLEVSYLGVNVRKKISWQQQCFHLHCVTAIIRNSYQYAFKTK